MHTHPIIEWEVHSGCTTRAPAPPHTSAPQAPAVGAGPPLYAVHAQHEGKGTGAGDYLDQAGLGLHLRLWECGQGRGQVS